MWFANISLLALIRAGGYTLWAVRQERDGINQLKTVLQMSDASH